MTDQKGPRAPLPPINFVALSEALLARAGQLVPDWLPGGVLRGHEYACGSLFGGAGSSCSVNLTTGKWSDFATGEAGNDLVSLYAAIQGLSDQMSKAAARLAREEGLEDVAGVQLARAGGAPVQRPVRVAPVVVPAVSKPDEGWATVVPVPEHAPAATFHHPYRQPGDIEHTACYMIDGGLQGYVVRFRTSDGGKDTLPYTWCTSARDGASRWHWKQWDEPRPLYFPGGVSPKACSEQALTVILVEGERKAGILQALLTAHAPGVYLVASWSGGCKAWKKADWFWLAGCTVLLWPDCDGKRVPLTAAERKSVKAQVLEQLEQIGGPITDNDRELAVQTGIDLVQGKKPLLELHKQPGMAAMLGIGALLRDAQGCTVQLLPIPAPLTVADGWDCADAIEVDGWDGAAVLGLFGKAYALPTEGAAPEAATPQKKSKVSLALDAWDTDADADLVKCGSRMVPLWLSYYYDATNKRWLASRKMVIEILERDPVLAPILAYNELSNNVQSRQHWPWPHSVVGDVTDAVDLLLGKYLTDQYGLPSISRAALMEAIQTVAHTRRFHPIREELQALTWDGKARINNWLVHILGESPDSLRPQMLEYLQTVGRCWLLGMINRVMQPGCKFDYCPVLEGVGGLRKSTMVEILAGTKYFSDTPFEVGRGKEAQEQVQGLWLYEIAEMTHFSKSEVGAIKAFITSKVDRYRVAYGATVGSFARQCVLVGTTNENTYLRDRTGNRRFWPIPVKHVINTEWLVKYRNQLLAEAYALYELGTPYTPTPEQEARLFVPMQESRLVETAVLSELLHVLTRTPVATGIGAVVNDLASFVTIAQLTLALGVDAAKSTPALEAQIRGWLDHEGWERVKKQINGARAWGYTRPVNWPVVQEDDDMTAAPEAGEKPPAPAEDGDDAPF